MTPVGVLGTGAFGTALAMALARHNKPVTLWGRDAQAVNKMRATGETPKLPGVNLHAMNSHLYITHSAERVLQCDLLLLAVPMQSLGPLLGMHAAAWAGKRLVACCKGIDLASLTGPAKVIAHHAPHATPAVLTGPSFAADIARGLPTALTLACADTATGAALQNALSTPVLRLYTTTDVTGAELGGALKNVIAIACGGCIGADMGESARAAVMTRGLAEITRLAMHLGARRETLMGLSGFGDLALTCTSQQSRNYRFGLALGRAESFDPHITVEGVKTAEAVAQLADRLGIDMPLCQTVHTIATGSSNVKDAMVTLLNRPLKEEFTCSSL